MMLKIDQSSVQMRRMWVNLMAEADGLGDELVSKVDTATNCLNFCVT